MLISTPKRAKPVLATLALSH